MAGKHYNDAQRRQILAIFHSRTESVDLFAQRYGIAASTLYKWQEKLADDHPSAFVEILPDAAPTPVACPMILQTPQATLHFQTLPDTDWLTELMQKMKS